MNISRLALDDFRSWQQCVIDFAPGLNVLVGHNGVGKTNIVESIEVLATGSSHRVTSSVPLVRRGCRTATIRANVDGHTYEMTIPARGANRARVDGGKSVYYREIAGRVRCVTFSPRDQGLVSGDPATRRSFLNAIASQSIPGYYAMATELTRVGKQRAALLKILGKRDRDSFSTPSGLGDGLPMGSSPASVPGRNAGTVAGADLGAAPGLDATARSGAGGDFGFALPDPTLSSLEAWTSQFVGLGIAVTRARARLVRRLAGPFARTYRMLAETDDDIALTYEPSLREVTDHDEAAGADGVAETPDMGDAAIRRSIGEHFQRIYAGEVARGANLIGPHRDDLLITLDRAPAKEFASNGEIWTMALALRMATFQLFCGAADEGPDDAGSAGARAEASRAAGSSSAPAAAAAAALGAPSSSASSVAVDRPILVLDDVFAQLDDSRRRQIVDFADQAGQVLITVASEGDIPRGIDARVIDVEDIARRDGDVFAALGLGPDGLPLADPDPAQTADEPPAAKTGTGTDGESDRRIKDPHEDPIKEPAGDSAAAGGRSDDRGVRP